MHSIGNFIPSLYKSAMKPASVLLVAMLVLTGSLEAAHAEPVTNTDAFAPMRPTYSAEEQRCRQELSLNGSWQFQPVAVPAGFRRNSGVAPELPPPSGEGWDKTPLKVPSPWNVNTWGNGRDVGEGTAHPYWPDSVYFPSYPAAWDRAEMGWVRRTFAVPAEWKGQRVLLHFEAVAGDCQVLINGKVAGPNHFEAYLPFDLDVTDLVKVGEKNEVMLGIRARSLFDQRSDKYARMHTPYPCGSNTSRLVGMWQDVSLRAMPKVGIANVFVMPNVASQTLEVQITVENTFDFSASLGVGADVLPHAPGQRAVIAKFDSTRFTLDAHERKVVRLTAKVPPGTLEEWSPGRPVLYDAKVSLYGIDSEADVKLTPFGWRQFKISGRDLLLNGRKIQLTGDLLHPFGAFVMSPAYARAWFQMIKDFGGNAVRLHAQPMPSFYLDLADEMGVVVLDETAIFGSAVSLNFEPDVAWQRFAEHYDGLVLRDRNHPSVLGWSFGNELFAIFNLNNVGKADTDKWYGKLAELGERSKALDPTRDWISCDGDEDLRGHLPVYSKHFGLGLPEEGRLPNIDKPLMVGESGGTYYARPGQLAIFNGDDAYASYAKRNDALGIDVYDNIVHMAKPKLAYFSASETAWFGVEHLGVGYRDTSRLPTKRDGVFFTAPFKEDAAGLQPERIPPYVTTLNPGWDTSLPLYRPLAMFEAEKAALANPPAACAWDHRTTTPSPRAHPPAAAIAEVRLIGDPHSQTARRLAELGVTLSANPSALAVVDADSLEAASTAEAQDAVRASPTTLVLTQGKSPATLALLAPNATVTDRTATALTADPSLGLSLPQLYFAEDREPLIIHHGLSVPDAKVLLSASNTDWSQFNNAPEAAKCGAAVLYEQLQKPAGAALVETSQGSGKVLLTTLDLGPASPNANGLWRAIFRHLGVKLGDLKPASIPAFDKDVLVSANLSPRLAGDAVPKSWTLTHTRDRYNLHEATAKASAEADTVYVSFWLNAPRATDDVFTAGPDAPKFDLITYASETCELRVNDKAVAASRTDPADYRALSFFNGVPLSKGWNHVVFKVTSKHFDDAGKPATLAVRMRCSNGEFTKQLDTAVERPER